MEKSMNCRSTFFLAGAVNATAGRALVCAQGWRAFLTLLVIPLSLGMCFSNAFAQSDIWRELIRTIHFADTTRAAVARRCLADPAISADPRLGAVCHKVGRIPDSVIEDAALPYLEHYVPERVAREGIDSLRTGENEAIRLKIIREIQAGKFEAWTPEELAALQRQNATPLGKALVPFAKDPAQSRDVWAAMIEY